MHLKQLIDFGQPLNHWTGENYGGSNVYDEYDNDTLVNSGCTLGVTGQTNQRFSTKAINLKDGQLIVSDGTFINDHLSLRDFCISFSFKCDAEPSGVKYIVSKWSPEQQFMIGFENGELVAKVQTDGGLVELSLDMPKVLYSGRWNYVTLRFTTNELRLVLNGAYTQVSNSSPVSISTLSKFTVGDSGANAFTSDFLINDINLVDTTYHEYTIAMYKLPRSEKDLYLDLNPEYFFDIANHYNRFPNKPCPNLGSAGGFGIISSGDAPNSAPRDSYTDRDYNRFGPSFFFALDTGFNPSDGIGGWNSVLADCKHDKVSNGGYSQQYKSNFMDISEDIQNPNNHRLEVSFASQSSFEWLEVKTKDATGTEITHHPNTPDYTQTDEADSASTYGIKLVKWDAANLTYRKHNTSNFGAQDSITAGIGGYAPNTPLNKLLFFKCDGSSSADYIDARNLCICQYSVSNSTLNVLGYPRELLVWNILNTVATPWLYTSGTEAGAFNVSHKSGPSYSIDYSHTSDWNVKSYDPLGNRLNDVITSAYFDNTGNEYTAQFYGEDNNDFNQNNFSVSFLVNNSNAADRYLMLQYVYNNSSYSTTTANHQGFQLFLNSKDGVFSHGDIEVGYDNMAAGFTISTNSQKVKDDGFHHIVWNRKGTINELWIDGQLEEVLITASIKNMDITSGSNHAWMVHGKSTYLADLYIYKNRTFSDSEIQFLAGGYTNKVTGYTTKDSTRIPSELAITRYDTGEFVNMFGTDDDGNFDIWLGKATDYHDILISSIPVDSSQTNHVVVHGPYVNDAVYQTYTNEVLSQAYSDYVLDMEPLAYYPLDETSGTTASDLSGNSLDGTYVGSPTLDDGGPVEGLTSVYFDGTDDVVTLPTGFSDFTNGVTIEAITNHDGSVDTFARIVELAQLGNTSTNIIYLLRDGTTNGLYADWLGSPNGQFTTSTGVENSQWKHLIYRIDSTGLGSLWVNGVQITMFDHGGIPPNVSRDGCSIGGSQLYPDIRQWKGNISNVGIYDYPLPKEEIERHAKRAFGYNATTLKGIIQGDSPDAYWTFDRLDDKSDLVGAYEFVANGSYLIERGSLVINDGTPANNYLSTSDYSLPATTWTIEVYVKTATLNTDGIVVSQWDQSAGTGSFKLALDNTGNFKFHYNIDANFIQSTSSYNDDIWHQVVITKDSNNDIRLYVDGEEEATVNSTFNNDLHDLVVGNDSTGDASWYLEGKTEIDDLVFYDRILSPVEIEQHHTQFMDKKETL